LSKQYGYRFSDFTPQIHNGVGQMVGRLVQLPVAKPAGAIRNSDSIGIALYHVFKAINNGTFDLLSGKTSRVCLAGKFTLSEVLRLGAFHHHCSKSGIF
jgi:hypothetical protein